MKPPCTKTCPDRSGTCHKTCIEWILYEQWKKQDQQRRDAEYARLNDSHSYRIQTARRFRRLIAEV